MKVLRFLRAGEKLNAGDRSLITGLLITPAILEKMKTPYHVREEGEFVRAVVGMVDSARLAQALLDALNIIEAMANGLDNQETDKKREEAREVYQEWELSQ